MEIRRLVKSGCSFLNIIVVKLFYFYSQLLNSYDIGFILVYIETLNSDLRALIQSILFDKIPGHYHPLSKTSSYYYTRLTYSLHAYLLTYCVTLQWGDQ